ncbi:MAG: VCBS repeat-containing protein [Phycisphaerales bacterium]
MAASIVIGLVASSECSAGSSRCRPPHFPIERLPFGSWARAFVAADFDGDGRTDLAAIGGDPPTLKVGLAELDGAFVGFESLPVGADPRDLVAGDVDGDGDIDLLVAVADANQVVIVRNDGAGGFDVVAALAAGEGTRSLAVGDVDGDGGLDLVAANGLAATVSVWLDACDPGIACGRTAPPFGPRVDLDAGPAPQSVRLADVDRDGNIDLLVCNASVEASTVALFRGLGDGSFAARLAVQAGRAPEGLVVVDLDGDGWLDLAVANAADETISVMRNATPRAGEPVFDPPQPSLAPKEPRRLAARDLAHDGFPELLVAAAQGSAIVRYENVDGVLAAGLPAIAVVAARALLVDDLDGDGRAEIVVGQDAAAPLVAHQQPNGFFADQFPLFEASNLAALVAADVLGDDAPRPRGGFARATCSRSGATIEARTSCPAPRSCFPATRAWRPSRPSTSRAMARSSCSSAEPAAWRWCTRVPASNSPPRSSLRFPTASMRSRCTTSTTTAIPTSSPSVGSATHRT